VARYKYLSMDRIVHEMTECNSTFYSVSNILARLGRNLLAGRNPLLGLVSNLTSRRNSMAFARIYKGLWQAGPETDEVEPLRGPRLDAVDLLETAAQQVRRLAATLKLRTAWFFRQP
jgi:hypothetical protein